MSRNSVEALITGLLETKSLSGQEDQVRQYIEAWFHDNGIETFQQGENLLVHLNGRDPKRGFIFNSHMDTVAADPSQWKSDPWKAIKEGDRITGLGASDMKSGLAASMLLAKRQIEKGKPPVDMWFTYVVREELDGAGSIALAKWFEEQGYFNQYGSVAALFTEPTDLKEIEHGHRGNMFIQAKTFGDGGHSSRPYELKTHAVRQMLELSEALQVAFMEWRNEFRTEIFEPPTIGELTSIHAGVGIHSAKDGEREIGVNSPNKFPEVCTATFDVRTVPVFHEVALKRMQEIAQSFGAEISYAFDPAPSGYTDPQDKLVQTAMKVMGSPELTVSQGAADMGFFSAHGVKAIITGPGDKSQMHQANESARVTQIPEAVDVYDAIVDGWAKE